MSIIKSKIDTRSTPFQENYRRMAEMVGDLQENLLQTLTQGKEKYVQRHQQAGKLLARDRVELLLDRDSPFLELMPLAGLGQKEMTLGGSVVGGIGLVSGVECLINASVPTIKGGAINKVSLLKSQRLDAIAEENRLPVIYLMESAGADLPQQAEVFNEGGEIFRNIARRSKQGIPSLTVVFGSCTAGGAYIPGMSDYVVMVRNQAKAFLAGPPLVRMATNEITDDESLGGADMHSKVSGLSDYLALDERDAIRQAREIMAHLNWQKLTPMPKNSIEPPRYDMDEILGIASADVRIPFDAREIITRLVDGSRFSEFKAFYGSTLVTGFAHIHGMPIGILANNGVLFSDSANKGTQFIQLCNQQNIPLLFLQNITGFMVGQRYEEGGIIKNGAKLINAISNSGVPAITVIMGASYGAGNYGMAGRAYKPRFLFSWPNAKLAVMGPDQLVGVMNIIQREAAAKAGQPLDEKQARMVQEGIRQRIEYESSAYYCTSRGWDDGIIDPRDTRNVLGLCLSVLHNAEIKGSKEYGVFRI